MQQLAGCTVSWLLHADGWPLKWTPSRCPGAVGGGDSMCGSRTIELRAVHNETAAAIRMFHFPRDKSRPQLSKAVSLGKRGARNRGAPGGRWNCVTKTKERAEDTCPLVYQCRLPLSTSTVNHLADLLRRHLKAIRSRWRILPPGKIAVIVLAVLRHDQRLADMAGRPGT